MIAKRYGCVAIVLILSILIVVIGAIAVGAYFLLNYSDGAEDGGPLRGSVVFVRHGESEWNAEELYTGWFDAMLTEKGKGQAKIAGKYLRSTHIHFDAVYTSLLTRAIRTTELILNEMPGMYNDTIRYSWLLNERHYGALTGQRKKDESERTENWNTRPLPMLADHPYYDVIYTDPRYENISSENCFPYTETLADAQLRFVRIWLATIASQVQSGKRILIVAHHNLLLGVIKYFDLVSDEAIMKIKIKNSVPFIYNFDENLIPQNKFAYLYGATESKAKNTTTN